MSDSDGGVTIRNCSGTSLLKRKEMLVIYCQSIRRNCSDTEADEDSQSVRGVLSVIYELFKTRCSRFWDRHRFPRSQRKYAQFREFARKNLFGLIGSHPSKKYLHYHCKLLNGQRCGAHSHFMRNAIFPHQTCIENDDSEVSCYIHHYLHCVMICFFTHQQDDQPAVASQRRASPTPVAAGRCPVHPAASRMLISCLTPCCSVLTGWRAC